MSFRLGNGYCIRRYSSFTSCTAEVMSATRLSSSAKDASMSMVVGGDSTTAGRVVEGQEGTGRRGQGTKEVCIKMDTRNKSMQGDLV